MREDLSFEPIKGGFTRRERVTEAYEVHLAITVGRLADGRLAISQRNITHKVGEASIPLTDAQARIVIAELSRALETPVAEGGSS